jgi:hypothetical protein
MPHQPDSGLEGDLKPVHGQVDLLNAQLPAKQGESSALQRQVPALGTALTEADTAVTAEEGEPTALPGRLPVVRDAATTAAEAVGLQEESAADLEAERPARPIP